jgi:exodeoxyribonuclease VII small subunit
MHLRGKEATMARKRTDSDPTAGEPHGDGLDTPASLRFGEAKERLERILEELESNEVDIDELAGRVKEAAALIRVLNDKLTRTRVEVEKVVNDVRAAEPSPGVADPGPAAECDDRSEAGNGMPF